MGKKAITLHPAQHDVYTEQLIHTDSPLYNVGGYICFRGMLDIALFTRIVEAAPRHFDAFRLRFQLSAYHQMAYVAGDDTLLPLEHIDATTQKDAAGFAREWMQADFNQPITLGPDKVPCRQALLTISNNEWWFYGKYHHLITDGYGFIVWIKYLAEAYSNAVGNTAWQYTPAPYLPQMQKAAAEHASGAFAEHIQYWKQKLTTLPPPLLQPATNGARGQSNGTIQKIVGDGERRRLQQLQQHGYNLMQLTVGALAVYYANSQQLNEVVVGLPLHKRASRQQRAVLGMFSGIIPFKTGCSAHMTVGELLHDIARQLSADYRHQQVTLGQIMRAVNLHQQTDELFQVIVNYEPFDFNPQFGPGLQATIHQLAVNKPRVPLQFTWQYHGEQQPLVLQVDYDTSYFTNQHIHWMCDSLFGIFWQMENSSLVVGAINILGDDEQAAIAGFNSTANNGFAFEPVTTMLQANAAAQYTALLHGEHTYSYAQLEQHSNRIAHYLQQLGVQPGQPVPVCVERSMAMVAAILGIVKAGGAYVPVDPGYPAERVAFMLNDVDAAVAVASQATALLVNSGRQVKVVLADDEATLAMYPSTPPQTPIQPGQTAYIIYTSGSTGTPKGVMITHGNLSAFLQWCRQYFNHQQFNIMYAATSVCFDLSVFELFYPLITGKTIRLLQNGLAIADYLSIDSKVFINTVPVVMDSLLQQGVLLHNVTHINLAGEPVPPHIVQGVDTRAITLHNLYGPTEDTTYSTVYQLHKDQPILIGKPIAGSYAYLLNQHLQQVPVGMAGELYLGGDGLAKGYWKRSDLTLERFIDNPFSPTPGSRLYKTGDVCRYLPNGNLEYLGRKDAQVKIRGYRVEPGEVEQAICHTGLVQNAVVTGYNGPGGRTLVGYLQHTAPVDTDVLAQKLLLQLPAYMVPAMWVQVSEMPLTPNGKIDRKQLPPPVVQTSTVQQSANNNPRASAIANIWTEILQVPHVDPNDNFFALGGHSITAMQMLNRVQKLEGVQVSYPQFANQPTIAHLLAIVAQHQLPAQPLIAKAPARASFPLSNAQMRTWVMCQLPGGSVTFNSPALFALNGQINQAAIEQALWSLVEKHPALRTVFVVQEHQPVQKVLTTAQCSFSLLVTDNPALAQDTNGVYQYFKQKAAEPFNLQHGPLVKAELLPAAPDSAWLFLNVHHIVADEWSKGLLIKDFAAALEAAQPAGSRQNSVNIDYCDYTIWHNTAQLQHEPYWRQQLAGYTPTTGLPLDFQRPATAMFSQGLVQQSLGADSVGLLQQLAVEHNVSLNNLLFALYGLLMCHHTGSMQVVIGALAAGRTHPDVEQVVGLFINFLPVTIGYQPNLSLANFLQQSNHTLLAAYQHQDYPFDKMAELFADHRQPGRNPLFDTMVNFHTAYNQESGVFPGQDNHTAAFNIKPVEIFRDRVYQSNLDCKLDVEKTGEGVLFSLSYQQNIFTPQRMEALLQQYIQLLLKAPGNSHAPVETLLTGEVMPGVPLETVQPKAATRVVIAATFVSEPLADYIAYWAGEYHFETDVQFAGFNQVFQQLLNPQSLLNTNNGVNVVLLRLSDWLRDQQSLTPHTAAEVLQQNATGLLAALEQCNGLSPIILMVDDGAGYNTVAYTNLLQQTAAGIYRQLEHQPGIVPVFADAVARLYNVEERYDAATDQMANMPYTEDYYAGLGTFICRKLRAATAKQYKVLALDCDNTLWKGICGELGPTGVEVNAHYAALQQFVLEKSKEGFLLALCSKNNEADVWEVFDNHPGMLLRRGHIAACRINWSNKPGNLQAIAEELNVGVDSVVFIDDNPFETEQVDAAGLGILSLCLPADETEIAAFLQHTWELDVFATTAEDTHRNQMYSTERQRKQEQEQHQSYEDFIRSLNIQVNIRPLEKNDLDRAEQMVLRTNQFNLNGIRIGRQALADKMQNNNGLQLVIDVTDRFGNYGITGLLLAQKEGVLLRVTAFLLSCRVLGRGVENIVWEHVQKVAASWHCETIALDFVATAKNKPFELFMQQAGMVPNAHTGGYQQQVKYSFEEKLV